MILRTKQKSHERTMRELERKLQIAKMKCEERNLKYKILKSYIPFHIKPKFNKLIVLLSIVAIISYTIAAILLQKYTLVELSPTLTTCVYGFFGTELLGLAGIKIFDTTDNALSTILLKSSLCVASIIILLSLIFALIKATTYLATTGKIIVKTIYKI